MHLLWLLQAVLALTAPAPAQDWPVAECDRFRISYPGNLLDATPLLGSEVRPRSHVLLRLRCTAETLPEHGSDVVFAQIAIQDLPLHETLSKATGVPLYNGEPHPKMIELGFRVVSTSIGPFKGITLERSGRNYSDLYFLPLGDQTTLTVYSPSIAEVDLNKRTCDFLVADVSELEHVLDRCLQTLELLQAD